MKARICVAPTWCPRGELLEASVGFRFRGARDRGCTHRLLDRFAEDLPVAGVEVRLECGAVGLDAGDAAAQVRQRQ